MTQLGWKTLAGALVVLAAGLARAQEPSVAPHPTCPKDCPACPNATGSFFPVRFVDSGCCSEEANSGCCAKEEKGSCCCGKAKSSCCADRGEGCACCAKAKAKTGCACCGSSSCCCGKTEKSCCCAEAKGCACCAKAAAGCACCSKSKCCCDDEEKETPNTPAKGRKNITVIVLPLPPLPGPFPLPPPVCFSEPLPPPTPIYRGEPVPMPTIAVAPPAPACPYMPPAPPVNAPYFVQPFQPAARIVAPAPAPVTPPVCCMAQSCRTESHGCSLRVVSEDGVDALAIHSGGDAHLVCDHLVLKVAGHKAVKATVVGKQVALSSPVLKAKADRVAVGGGDDRIILDGHVRLEYRLGGAEECSVVIASHVVLNLAQDQVEVTGVGSCATQTNAGLPAAAEELFNAWTGFCR